MHAAIKQLIVVSCFGNFAFYSTIVVRSNLIAKPQAAHGPTALVRCDDCPALVSLAPPIGDLLADLFAEPIFDAATVLPDKMTIADIKELSNGERLKSLNLDSLEE